VILTGTPAGVGPLASGDVLQIELVGLSRFVTRVL
jgi:2-keto-4-pentenoate hydratase/2-oxohepta-3-ene-1,7-dioic acid hydratase in catechol pathway